MSEHSIPVLCLHHVSDLDYYTAVGRDKFLGMAGALADRFQFVTCAQARRRLDERLPFERPPVVVTFDDGYDDNHEPLLEAHERFGFVATVFPVVDHIARTNAWNGKASYVARHMGSAQLRSLSAAGFEIGSHTLDHTNLLRHDAAELDRQLRESRRILEDLLGCTVETVAYPYGFFDDKVVAAASEVYRTGLSTGSKGGGLDWMRDAWSLRRFSVSKNTDIDHVVDVVEHWGASQ